MENKCKCGESCDCVSRKKYEDALKATAYLANKVKVLEEKYKLALFSSEEKKQELFQPPTPPELDKTIEEPVKGWGKKSYGEPEKSVNQIKVKMVNDLPPGTNINQIVLEDKDTILDDECEACSA